MPTSTAGDNTLRRKIHLWVFVVVSARRNVQTYNRLTSGGEPEGGVFMLASSARCSTLSGDPLPESGGFVIVVS